MVFSFLTYSQNVEAIITIIFYLIAQLPKEPEIQNMWLFFFISGLVILITGKF